MTDELIKQVALLAWILPSKVKAYHDKLIETQEKSEKQRWKSHPLYCFKTKNQLESMCKQLKQPITSSMSCAIRKMKNNHQKPIVNFMMAMSSHLTIPKLKSILSYHHMPSVGKTNLFYEYT